MSIVGKELRSRSGHENGITVDEIREALGYPTNDYKSLKVVPDMFIDQYPDSEVVVGWDLNTYKITQIKNNA